LETKRRHRSEVEMLRHLDRDLVRLQFRPFHSLRVTFRFDRQSLLSEKLFSTIESIRLYCARMCKSRRR
jgi:hypothetical protein